MMKNKFNFVLCVLVYALSLSVLFLQLIAFYGSSNFYIIFIFIHFSTFSLTVLIVSFLKKNKLLLIFSALILGAIPYQPTFELIDALLNGNEYSYSSLTKGLPKITRVAYEILFFPVLQLFLLCLILLPRNLRSQG